MPAARKRAMPRPATCRVRVFDGDDDLGNAGVDQRIAARRRAAVVRAGFERDVGGGAAGRGAGGAQRHDFGVGGADALGVTFGDSATTPRGDRATDSRIRFTQAKG